MVSLLSCLAAPAARAQGQGQDPNWSAQDPNHKPLFQDPDGSYELSYTISGDGQSTYPGDMDSNSWYDVCVFCPLYWPAYFGGPPSPYEETGFYGWVQNYDESHHSDFYNGGNGPEPINGTVDSNVQVPFVGDFVWNGPGAAPDHLNVLIRTYASASAYLSYSSPQVPSGLSAHVYASDGLGTNVSATGSLMDFNTGRGGDGQTGGKAVLKRISVGSGVAEVNLLGTLGVSASNESVYSQDGRDEADFAATVTAGARPVTLTVGAHSTQDTVGWDPTHPRFFSGTNCTASGSIDVDPSLISQAQLLINDQPVKTYPDSNNPSATPSLSVTFDSTHFQDGTPITIKYKVWDTAGDPPVEEDVAANAYNELYSMGNQDLDGFRTLQASSASILNVAIDAQAMNYVTTASIEDHAPGAQLNLTSKTAFYAFTHGYPGNFASSYGTPDNNDWLNSGDGKADPQEPYANGGVGYVIAQKTLNIPPFNFVQIDGCDAGATSELAIAFGVFGLLDTAFLGWEGDVLASWYDPIAPGAGGNLVNFTDELWQQMGAGRTLYDAALLAITDNTVYGGDSSLSVHPIPPYIYGDAKMKLHGVYLGTDASQWFR